MIPHEAVTNALEDIGHGQEESVGSLMRRLESDTRTDLGAEKQGELSKFIAGLRSLHHDTIVTMLPDGVGGVYDGSDRYLSVDVLQMGGSTFARAQEVDAHEKKHEDGNHTNAYATYGDGAFIELGGIALSQEEFIEGWTVYETGADFVSQEYRGFRNAFAHALNASKCRKEEVAQAIDDTHDLRVIDDRCEQAV